MSRDRVNEDSLDTSASSEEEEEEEEENNDSDSDESNDDSTEDDEEIVDLSLNKDGTLKLKHVPPTENGLLEPLVHHRERQVESYRVADLALLDELNNAEQKEFAKEFAEVLPVDHAYFVQASDLPSTHHKQQRIHVRPLHHVTEPTDQDYFEQPDQESLRPKAKKSTPLESVTQKDDDDSSSEESSLGQEMPISIENNPLESFLESLVSKPAQSSPSDDEDQSSEENTSSESNSESSSSSSEEQEEKQQPPVKWNQKRTYVIPEPTVERPATSSGLVDLIANPDQAYFSGEYNSDEDSGEKQNQQALLLSPSAANVWVQPDEQWQYQSDEQEESAYKPSMGGLIDLLTAHMRVGPHAGHQQEQQQQDDSSSSEYETTVHHRQRLVAMPKRTHVWVDEERSVITPVITENGPSASWQDVQNQEEINQLEKIRSNLNVEQDKFIDALHEQNVREQLLEDSGFMAPLDGQPKWLVQIRLNRNVEKHEAEDLLSFISQLTAVDSSLIKDISVGQNSIGFRLDSSDLTKKDVESFIQEIVNHEQQIKKEKGLTILAASLVNDDQVEKQRLWDNDETRKYFLVIVTVCGSALAILVTLLSIFVVRRRAYLRNKLRNELNLPKKKKKFDDVERLVEGEQAEQSRFKRFMGRLCGKKSSNGSQEAAPTHDSTPGKDAEKVLSRQTHSDYQELCRSEEFLPTHLMTTPVTTNTDMSRKTNAAESNRSSTSS